MAQIIQRKFTLDTEDRKAVGFDFPINGNAVFNPTYQTKDQIKANLVNYLLTNKGERVFNPNFGSDLRSLLFENIVEGNLEELKGRIQSDIRSFFPTVDVKQVKFNNQPDNNTVNFILVYEIKNFGVTDSIDILLQ